MLYVDIPTVKDFKALYEVRADACVSIYLETTPLTQEANASRIEFKNLVRQAREQLHSAGFDKRRLATLTHQLEELEKDDTFWQFQAYGLAVLATPDEMKTMRLPVRVASLAEVSDRFHLKPLLRMLALPASAFILALSENAVQLHEMHADLSPMPVKVEGLPKDAASAVGKSTLNDRSPKRRIQGLEGQNVRYEQYVQQINDAIAPILAEKETPLILASTGRLADIFRSLNTYPHLLPTGIDDSPDRMTEAELAEAARKALKEAYAMELEALKDIYETRTGEGLTSTSLTTCAKAATFGAIDTLLVDIDSVVPGTLDDQGLICFADAASACNYGVVDEIAGRALASGAKVFGVPREELPGQCEVAAVLRYAM